MGWRDAVAAKATPAAPGGLAGVDSADMLSPLPAGDDPAAPGFLTGVRAGMVEDPQARARVYARARFSDLPPEQAEQRAGTFQGDPVFADDAGRLRPARGGMARAGEIVGDIAPPILGGLAGTPGGPPGMALGAMSGLSARKLGGLAQGDRQSAGGNAIDLIVEGALNWAGAKLGQLGAKTIGNRRLVGDLSRMDPDETARLTQTAAKYGITLTPAEATNLGSLIQQQSRLATGFDDAGDMLSRFYGDRAGQVRRVVDDFIGATPSASQAGASVREVAAQTLDDAAAARDTAAGPLYRALDKANPQIDPKAFETVEADDLIRGYIDKAVSDPKFGVMDQPRNSYAVIDRAGKLMGDEAETLARAGRNYEAGLVSGKRRELLGRMEQVVPGYRDARRAFAQGQEYVDELEGGFEGVLARIKDTQLAKVPKDLLTSSKYGPGDVSRWRKLFVSQGKEAEWDGLTRVFLRDVWEGPAQKGRTVKNLAGAKWAEQIMGTPRQQEMLREALGPARFRDLKDLTDVLAATARASRGQSMTEPAMQAAAREQLQAAPIKTAARNLSLVDPMGELREMLIGRDVDQWRRTLAQVITSPDGVKQLEQMRLLRSLSPSSERRVAATVNLLGQQLPREAGAAAMRDRPTQAPPALAR